ncbi:MULTISPECIES: acyl carrier protein [Fictibacillus]|jgi:acyl carrier protein|uniref:acyl carrier protein n=1 Tax=Fictibacillus TaxID=1329200 RepID=UPI001E3321CD|nr:MULTISPECIES: acyl carrier protein [Fictibacillus]
MMKEIMKEKIKLKFISSYKLSLTPDEIDDDAALFGVNSPYGLDSMDVLFFINHVKQDYELELGAIDTESFKTVNNIVNFIEKQAQERQTN